MKKADILRNYRVDKLNESTVFISGKEFYFSYTIADTIVKDEYKGQYRYFGGLQCSFNEGSVEYKNLENWLCEIAEQTLNIIKLRY
jgi:hypothetical protein